MAANKTTSTVTINAAFLQEIKEVNADLWDLLSETQRFCSDTHHAAAHCRELVSLLATLRDNLAMHFALEEAYGYFDDPVTVQPHLSAKADTLREQHAVLYKRIRDLAESAEQLLYDKQLSENLPKLLDRLHGFFDQLQNHEMEENELILKAYDDDIGVGD